MNDFISYFFWSIVLVVGILAVWSICKQIQDKFKNIFIDVHQTHNGRQQNSNVTHFNRQRNSPNLLLVDNRGLDVRDNHMPHDNRICRLHSHQCSVSVIAVSANTHHVRHDGLPSYDEVMQNQTVGPALSTAAQGTRF